MISPSDAIKCLAEAALTANPLEPLAIYDSVTVLASAIPPNPDEHETLDALKIKSAEAAAAIRMADTLQLEFRDFINQETVRPVETRSSQSQKGGTN